MCGRAVGSYQHPGNKNYRALIQDQKLLYNSLTNKFEKRVIYVAIVAAIRADGGRFLQQQPRTGEPWCEIGDKKAVETTSIALRRALKQKKQAPAHKTKAVDIAATTTATATSVAPESNAVTPNTTAAVTAPVITDEEAATHTHQQYCKMMSSYNAIEECDQYDIKDDVYLQAILRRCRTYSQQHNNDQHSALTHKDSMDFAVLVFLMNHYIAEINYRKSNNIEIFPARRMVLCTIQAIHYAIGIVFNYDRVTLIYESIQRVQLLDGLKNFDNIFWKSGNTLGNIANQKPSIVGPLDGLPEDHGVYRDGIMSTDRLKDIVHDYKSIQEGEFRFLEKYTRYVCCFIEKPDGMLEIFNNRQGGNNPFFITVKNEKVPIVFFIVHGIVNKSVEKAIIGFRQQAIK